MWITFKFVTIEPITTHPCLLMFDFVVFDVDFGLYLLRLGVGTIFLYHAWGKLIKSKKVAKMLKWSPISIQVLGLAELFAALMLIIGVYVQFGAAILTGIMIGAIYYHVYHWQTPFSSTKGKGFELDLLLLCSSLAILLSGGGSLGFIQYFAFMQNLPGV